ncbi:hypothetical protein DRF59_06675 [Chryseobacterium flavum]|uniref:C1q domain-containing protein n=1 Tax=Chryseobacterium flavum TaxID=415851 RepID=A0A3D9CQE8_9FLAO|nr:hypothetical protein [Chryseobacterium flavum]REC67990.1 hypothetical protein DRF59_06675 [Chryseobacterium flavum]
MKKIISMVFLIVGFSTVYSQIGINTPNPQQAFHLDGKKNNPETEVPNANQVTDDFVVTDNGRIGIGTISPDASAALHLAGMDKGFLPSRVMLQSTDDTTTIASPAIGLLVYNFMTAGTYPKNVTPGYYYWDGKKWSRFSTGSSSGSSDALYLIADSTLPSMEFNLNSDVNGKAITILKEFHNPGGYSFNKNTGSLVVSESGLYFIQFQAGWYNTTSTPRTVSIGIKQGYPTNNIWKGRTAQNVAPVPPNLVFDLPIASSGYFSAYLTAGTSYVLTTAVVGGSIKLSTDKSPISDPHIGTNENKGWSTSFIIKKIL